MQVDKEFIKYITKEEFQLYADFLNSTIKNTRRTIDRIKSLNRLLKRIDQECQI